MYVGHFAIGVAIKSATPKTPTMPIMLGVALMDIVNGLFVVAGVDRVTPNLNSGLYLFFDLTFIDWIIRCSWRSCSHWFGRACSGGTRGPRGSRASPSSHTFSPTGRCTIVTTPMRILDMASGEGWARRPGCLRAHFA